AALEPHLARHVNLANNAFAALNTAFFDDGAFVHIARGAVLDRPLHALYVSTAADATVTYPRNLVVAEENAQAQVVESYVGCGAVPPVDGAPGGAYFTNAVT